MFPCISFSQTDKKMNKNFNVSIPNYLYTNKQVFFDRKNPDKHGWDKTVFEFSKSFRDAGFNITDNKDSGVYIIQLDYDYGYVISQYKMQYSNLRGAIIFNSNVVGNFSYNGRYDNDELSAKAAPILKTHFKNIADISVSKVAKSKEEKLLELKDLLDKKLITQQDYDQQKQKILNSD